MGDPETCEKEEGTVKSKEMIVKYQHAAEHSLSVHRMAFLLAVLSLSLSFSEKRNENVEFAVISIRGIQE